jgi:hypothetical protein
MPHELYCGLAQEPWDYIRQRPTFRRTYLTTVILPAIQQVFREEETSMNITVQPETLTPKERWQLWRRGWRDGAGVRAKRHQGQEDYERGYGEGYAVFCKASDVERRRLGVPDAEVSPLREDPEVLG